jgi:hypothetical protein
MKSQVEVVAPRPQVLYSGCADLAQKLLSGQSVDA